MERIIGRRSFEDFGITEEMYLNDTDWARSYDIFSERYSLLVEQILTIGRRYAFLQRNRPDDAVAILKAYKMLYNEDNSDNPFYKMETIEVKDGWGVSDYGKICVINYFNSRIKDGIYKVIMPPIIVDRHSMPYRYTPCVVNHK